jgi:serine/threonine protein kinase
MNLNLQANILIDNKGDALLCDFGLISVAESQAFGASSTAHGSKGTIRFMAPELLNPEKPGARKTRPTDVYAFGITIIQVC